jgi:hypothetical protein
VLLVGVDDDVALAEELEHGDDVRRLHLRPRRRNASTMHARAIPKAPSNFARRIASFSSSPWSAAALSDSNIRTKLSIDAASGGTSGRAPSQN